MKTLRLLAVALTALPAALAAAPADAPPPFAFPFNPANFNMTAAYDLNRTTGAGQLSDWTGWVSGEATAGFGHAYDNHSGTDTGMIIGTPLNSAANGTVNSLRESVPNNDHSDTGNYLILNHNALAGRNWRTRYWHLAQNGVHVSVGQSVTKGQYVCDADNTGNSTGSHLHYGVSILPADVQTCPYYNGWWEQDEWFRADGRPCLVYINIDSAGALNCREGNTLGHNIFTTLPQGNRLVASQQNTWWRLFLPLPPAFAREARTAGGALAAGYSETGSWTDSASKATVSHLHDDPNRVVLTGQGSRVHNFATTPAAGTFATWSFTAPNQRGNYDLYAAWPADANCANVTYRITHASGTTDVTRDQVGNLTVGGTGTKANPFRITTNPYIVNHTTVGAPSEWLSYSPVGVGIPQNGPENLYHFMLRNTGNVKVTVDHTGYPTKDIDIHLLNAPSNTSCIQRADWTFTASSLAAATYYIACDSYGSGAAGANAATNYTLRVDLPESEPLPNTWVHLGTYFYDRNAAGSVQLRSDSSTGRVDTGQPGKLAADAIRIVPRITRRTAWASNGAGLTSRINTGVTPVASVVIKTDQNANNDSNDFNLHVEVPIFESPSGTTVNNSAIVGKAVTGQRFVVNVRSGDWYQVDLTNATAATKGWLLGDHLIGWHLNTISSVDEWELY